MAVEAAAFTKDEINHNANMIGESTEGQTNIDFTANAQYNYCGIDSVFNAIQFQILMIDIRDKMEYNTLHIRQAFHISTLHSISVSAQKQLFVSKDTFVPIYIYNNNSNSLKDDKKNKDILIQICELLIINGWVKNEENLIINIMKDGFIKFFKQYPFECTQQILDIPYQYTGSLYPNIVIHDALYYGNAEQASNGNVIKHLKITHILNITNLDFEIKWDDKDVDEKEEKVEIKYLKLPIHDNEDNKISVYFDKANNFINNALNENNMRVLVHCMFGSSRSGTILVQYVMNRNKISLYEAYKYIYQCRPCLYPNESFMNELENTEIKLFDLDKTKTTRKKIEQSYMR